MRLKNDAAEKYFLYAGIMKVKKDKTNMTTELWSLLKEKQTKKKHFKWPSS